jgi:hypothetical protein
LNVYKCEARNERKQKTRAKKERLKMEGETERGTKIDEKPVFDTLYVL